ncbi:MAG: Ig-like domain-containing protein [Gemmatimonadaceae bacterium]
MTGRRAVVSLACAWSIASCGDGLANGASTTRVEITPQSLSLRSGETNALTARVVDETGTTSSDRRVFWSSEHPAIATVSQSGVVTAVGPGTTQIAASHGGRSAIVPVTVTALPVSLVRVSPTTSTVVVGASVRLSAEALNAGGGVVSGRTVAWRTSNAALATVNSTGLVTGIAEGTATISATVDGISGTAVVTLQRAAVATVTVSPSTGAMLVGQSLQLNAATTSAAGAALTGRAITWASSAPAIASVSSAGLVIALSPGAATISASSEGRSASSQITVSVVPVHAVKVVPGTATVAVNRTAQLFAQVTDAGGSVLTGRPVTWTTDRPAVATVSGDGLVSAIAAGQVRITARSEGEAGTATITVTSTLVASVTVAPNPATIQVGATQQFTATPKGATGLILTGRIVTWVSGAPSVATIDQAGLVTAIGAGTTLIIATCEGQPTAATLTVTPRPVSSVTVSPSTSTLVVGGALQLNAVITDDRGATVAGKSPAWSSSAPSVATVSAAGRVAALTVGSAVVSATSDGVVGTAILTIAPVPVATVTLAPATASLGAGQTAQLAATVRAANGIVLSGRATTWSSSANAVATVNASGRVTAVAPGTAQISANVEGVTGTATVTVAATPVASIAIAPDPVVVVEGGAAQITATVRDARGLVVAVQSVVWAVVDSRVASISATGMVTGLKAGTTSINVSAAAAGQSPPATRLVTLTVNPPPSTRVAGEPRATVKPRGATR